MSKIKEKQKLWHEQRGVCVLCGGVMPYPGEPAAEGRQASEEHLLPRSKGGEDTSFNIALTHKRCNEQRGSNPLTQEQVSRLYQLRGVKDHDLPAPSL